MQLQLDALSSVGFGRIPRAWVGICRQGESAQNRSPLESFEALGYHLDIVIEVVVLSYRLIATASLSPCLLWVFEQAGDGYSQICRVAWLYGCNFMWP